MTRTPLLLLAATASFLGFPSGARAETNFGQVAMHVAYMLQNHHYSKKDFDDEASKRLLKNYLNLLDPRHIFFTQQDAENFTKMYDTTLDDHVLMRNISPALEIYDVYLQRVRDRVGFLKKALETQKFTFDSSRTLEVKRDKVPWPKDKATSDKLWLDIIEDALIQERLIDKNRIEAEKKKAAEKAEKEKQKQGSGGDQAAGKTEAKAVAEKKPAKADADDESKMTPEQRIAKDYDRLLESVEENSDTEEVVNFFLSCLATTYDPHTEYMSFTEINNFNIQMKHSLVGIGALLGKTDDGVEIQGIVVGGPADKQGELQLDDRIVAVSQGENGEFVDVRYKRKLQDVVDMIRGEKDTIVRLKIVPADDPAANKIITIKRAEVELKDKVATAELIQTPAAIGRPMKVGWINLSSFYADMEEGKVSTTVDCERLLRRLMKEGMEGLVFDLRGNGGGSLEEAIKLTGLFIPGGPVVQAKDWRDSITQRESDTPKPVYDGPMIVLTDKASASASEIFAAALQDYRRAIVVGDKSTFGKGTVQTILPVERYMPFFADKSRAGALKVTIQKFYRIAGGSTQLRGVIPDLVLPSIRDVMDIGEAAADNPLPYDTIPALTYAMWRKDPFPVEQLQSRLNSRIASNPEFQVILEESRRLKERIDRNTISLSEAEREKERADTEARRKKQDAERAERVKQVAATLKGDGVKTYHLTLDNVDKPGLVLESKLTREQSTGMRLAKNSSDDEEEDRGSDSKFPYGIEPVKLETMHIMRDLLETLKVQPTTARTEGNAKE